VELHLYFPPYDLLACKQPASIFSLPNIVNCKEIKVDERGVVHHEVLVFATCDMQHLSPDHVLSYMDSQGTRLAMVNCMV